MNVKVAKITIGGKTHKIASDSKAYAALSGLAKVTQKCTCGRPAIYMRKYEGRAYCTECFLNQIERQFKRNVRELALKKGEKIAVALSGGKDSCVLLYLFSELAKQMPIKVEAIIVDEGIKRYRSTLVMPAKALCKRLGVPLHVASFKKEFGVALDELPKDLVKDTWCSWCGVLRRRVLNNAARELGCTKLAVAHNLDDTAQSVMMGFIRGDYGQFQRLGHAVARSNKWVERIKPLRNIPETETTLYALLRNIKFSDARCPHSHEMIRQRVRTFLNELEREHAGTKFQILNFYDRLQPKLVENARTDVNVCNVCGEPASGKECRVCGLLKQLKR